MIEEHTPGGAVTCTKCKAEPVVSGQRWGKNCKAAYMREYRKNNKPRSSQRIADLEREFQTALDYLDAFARVSAEKPAGLRNWLKNLKISSLVKTTKA